MVVFSFVSGLYGVCYCSFHRLFSGGVMKDHICMGYNLEEIQWWTELTKKYFPFEPLSIDNPDWRISWKSI